MFDRSISGERAIKRIDSGKNNPNAGKVDLFGEIEPAKINPTKNSYGEKLFAEF